MSKEKKVAKKAARKHRREDIKAFRKHRKLTRLYESVNLPTWKTILEGWK